MAQCFVDNIIYGQLYYAVFGRLFHSPLSMFTACLWGNFLIVWSESLQLGYRDCQSRGIFYSVKGLADQYLMEALKYGRYSSSFCDNVELLAFIIIINVQTEVIEVFGLTLTSSVFWYVSPQNPS